MILGSGGFEKNLELRERFQPKPTSIDWTTGAESNTGGGHLAGMDAGADVALMDDAWWGPTIPLPRGPWFALAERNLPGSIIVNSAGKRFMNEALPYVEAVHEIYKGEETGVSHVPAWMIIDQRYRNRYLFAGLSPRQPFPGRWYKHGTIKKADTLDALAAEIEVPADALAGHRRPVQRVRDVGHRRGLPPRRERLRQVLLRPHGEAEPVAAQHRPGTRSTPSRSCPATSAPRAGWSPTSAPGCCAPTAPSSRACTPPATSPPPSWATPTPARAPPSGPAIVFGYLAAEDIARSSAAPVSDAVSRTDRREGGLLMPIDPEVAIGAQLPDRTFSWESSDVLLYHLGIGAGSRPGDNVDPTALRYTARRRRPAGAAQLRHRRADVPRDRPAAARPARLRHQPVPGRARQPGDPGRRPAALVRLGACCAPGSPTSGTRARPR